jgi:Tfp pilus assembly protein PilO
MRARIGLSAFSRASRLRRVTRTQVCVALGLILLFDLVFYFFAVKPLSAREQKKRTSISILSQQAKQRTEQVAKLKMVVDKVEQARSEGDKLIEEITLVRRTTFSTLVAELDAAAQESGVEARESAYDVQPIEGAEQYGMVTISANFRGRYENLVKFLNRLDRSENFLIIESLGAAPRADSEELNVTMKIDTFVREL